jgi:phosphoglycerol transferase MdoB-like AlkP superfamily enzyme
MQRIKTAIKLMIVVLMIYLVLRIIFQYNYYSSLSVGEEFKVLYWGFRLDFAAIFYINIPFFIFYFFIAPFFSWKWQQLLAVIIFSLINLPFIALNLIDLVYYGYNLRRSTVDLFYVFTDSIHSFGALFWKYWFIFIAFIIGSIFFVKKVKRIVSENEPSVQIGKWQYASPLLFIAVCFLIARGLGERPIVPATALLKMDATKQPLVNNSTLNMLYSWYRTSTNIERKNYFPPSVLDTIYTIRREYQQQQPINKRNIVIFLLESFNESFFTPGTDRAKTPFFDSIMQKSTVCLNAYANGHESSKGAMAVLGSIPPFPDEPLFISNYSGVRMKGIGTILKEEGYDTNFFLGAEYDHFNFAKLCRMAGIDNYYSKDSYGKPGHDDGNWGVYDEYFFNYFADVVNQKKNPFFALLYNISSHPPFAIPANEKALFSIAGQSAQQNSITYVDDCFRRLFEKIKNQPWFSNTVFVFCSDHTLLKNVYDKSYQYKGWHIPLFVYDPTQREPSVINGIVQQMDIVPSILDKIHYAKPFMSFGSSIYRPETEARRFSIYRAGDHYQLIDSTTITGYDSRAEKTIYHYNFKTDSLLTRNLVNSGDSTIFLSREKLIRAIVQRFNNSMRDQDLMIK